MNDVEALKQAPLNWFENDNKKAYQYAGSEWRPWNLKQIEYWISIRNNFTFVEDYQDGNWQQLDIKTSHTKYGLNYIYIEPTKKLWRIKQTINEFYPGGNVYD